MTVCPVSTSVAETVTARTAPSATLWCSARQGMNSRTKVASGPASSSEETPSGAGLPTSQRAMAARSPQPSLKTSSSRSDSQRSARRRTPRSGISARAASAQALMAPTLVPQKIWGSAERPWRGASLPSAYRRTPASYAPRAPPPERTSANGCSPPSGILRLQVQLQARADGERLLVEEVVSRAAQREVRGELEIQLGDRQADRRSDRCAHAGEEVPRLQVERHGGAHVEGQQRWVQGGAEPEGGADARVLPGGRIHAEGLGNLRVDGEERQHVVAEHAHHRGTPLIGQPAGRRGRAVVRVHVIEQLRLGAQAELDLRVGGSCSERRDGYGGAEGGELQHGVLLAPKGLSCTGPGLRVPRPRKVATNDALSKKSTVPAVRSGGQREHPTDGLQRALPQVLGQGDLRRPVAHAEIDLLQRVQAHVGTDRTVATRAGRSRDQLRVRARLLHQVEDSHLGRDDEALRRTALHVFEQPPGGADVVRDREHALLALRMGDELRLRVPHLELRQLPL